MVIFIVLWPYLLATNLRCLQKNTIGHTNLRSQEAQQEEYLSDEHIREGRNLASVFPFVGGNRALPRARLFGEDPDHHEHHDEHHEHHDEHRNFDPRISRQRNGDEDEIALDIGSIAAAGERCIDKVVMVEETEYDDVVTCKHSYSEKCHTTYTTDFEPQQEEDCEENFVKSCFIEYK